MCTGPVLVMGEGAEEEGADPHGPGGQTAGLCGGNTDDVGT